jgi:hypothetical protein
MVDLCLVRHERYRSLVPATDIDYDRLARIPREQPFECLVRFSRTSKLNRWYRGLVAKVAEAIGANPDGLHMELKLKAQLVERVLAGTGGIVAVQLRSTAFPAMEDVEFSNYCDLAVELLHRDYLPHVRAREWQKQIIEWAGRRPAIEAPPRLLRI